MRIGSKRSNFAELALRSQCGRLLSRSRYLMIMSGIAGFSNTENKLGLSQALVKTKPKQNEECVHWILHSHFMTFTETFLALALWFSQVNKGALKKKKKKKTLHQQPQKRLSTTSQALGLFEAVGVVFFSTPPCSTLCTAQGPQWVQSSTAAGNLSCVAGGAPVLLTNFEPIPRSFRVFPLFVKCAVEFRFYFPFPSSIMKKKSVFFIYGPSTWSSSCQSYEGIVLDRTRAATAPEWPLIPEGTLWLSHPKTGKTGYKSQEKCECSSCCAPSFATSRPGTSARRSGREKTFPSLPSTLDRVCC